MLSLTLFGSMCASLEHADGLRPLTLTPRVAELLAFLAVGRGRFFCRGDIAQSVWNSDNDAVTVASVNTALWRLRRAIEQSPAKRGDFLATNSQGAVGLSGPQRVTLDVADFERLIRNGTSKPLHDLTAQDCESLRAGVALYRDNALADFDGMWALKERERLRNAFQSAAGRLMQFSELHGQYDQAIEYARLVLAVDALREDIHRDLMRYYVCTGQRALALRQFEQCRAALKREFAIQPMEETTALYRQIADDAVAVSKREGVPVVAETATLSASRWRVGAGAGQRMARPRSKHSHPATVRVETARSLLAQADDQLSQTLKLIDP